MRHRTPFDLISLFFAKFAPDVPVVYLFFIPGKQVLQIKQGDAAAEAVILAHSSNEEVQRQVARIVYGSACSEGRLSASIGSRFAAGWDEYLFSDRASLCTRRAWYEFPSAG